MFARKKCKLVQGESLRSSTATLEPIDWSLCALCQERSDKSLICPAKSKRKDIGAGYDTLGDYLSSYRSVGNQPLPIDINKLDEGDGISNTLKCSASRISRI